MCSWHQTRFRRFWGSSLCSRHLFCQTFAVTRARPFCLDPVTLFRRPTSPQCLRMKPETRSVEQTSGNVVTPPPPRSRRRKISITEAFKSSGLGLVEWPFKWGNNRTGNECVCPEQRFLTDQVKTAFINDDLIFSSFFSFLFVSHLWHFTLTSCLFLGQSSIVAACHGCATQTQTFATCWSSPGSEGWLPVRSMSDRHGWWLLYVCENGLQPCSLGGASETSCLISQYSLCFPNTPMLLRWRTSTPRITLVCALARWQEHQLIRILVFLFHLDVTTWRIHSSDDVLCVFVHLLKTRCLLSSVVDLIVVNSPSSSAGFTFVPSTVEASKMSSAFTFFSPVCRSAVPLSPFSVVSFLSPNCFCFLCCWTLEDWGQIWNIWVMCFQNLIFNVQ